MHANSGVEKGMAAGGKPVEIMGMMLGRPDTETPNALIVTDVSDGTSVTQHRVSEQTHDVGLACFEKHANMLQSLVMTDGLTW